MAKRRGVNHFLVISSIGANAQSRNFYLRTKGEMEEAVKSIGFEKLTIVRPSLLLGERAEFRLGEQFGKVAMNVLSIFLVGKFKKFNPIEASVVAKAMILAEESFEGRNIIESDAILELGKE